MNSQIEQFNENGMRFAAMTFSENLHDLIMLVNNTRVSGNEDLQRITFYDFAKLTQCGFTTHSFLKTMIRLDDDVNMSDVERRSLIPIKDLYTSVINSTVLYNTKTRTFENSINYHSNKSISSSIRAIETYCINVSGIPHNNIQLNSNGLVLELDTYSEALNWDVAQFEVFGIQLPIEEYRSTNEYQNLLQCICEVSRLQGQPNFINN